MRRGALVLSVLLTTCARLLAEPASVSGNEVETELIADIDGNGKNDRLVRVRHKKDMLFAEPGERCRFRPGIFLRYLLYRDSGEPEEVLDYFIGTDEATYWVHKIEKVEDIDKDGSLDLVFYAGDDTSGEYVFILQKPSHFEAVYSGVSVSDEHVFNEAREIVTDRFEEKPKVVGRWSSTAEAFEGFGIAWISGDCVNLRAEPNTKGKIVQHLLRGDIVRLVQAIPHGDWFKVRIGNDEGYVNSRYLSKVSPRKRFGGEAAQ